jgi:hypothetical protein
MSLAYTRLPCFSKPEECEISAERINSSGAKSPLWPRCIVGAEAPTQNSPRGESEKRAVALNQTATCTKGRVAWFAHGCYFEKDLANETDSGSGGDFASFHAWTEAMVGASQTGEFALQRFARILRGRAPLSPE